ncbi:MAG: hypothetical protein ACK4TA_17250 [Saprospiraceae bacterium]
MKILLSLILFLGQTNVPTFSEVENKVKAVTSYSQLIELIQNEIAYPDIEGNKISFTIIREIGNDFQQIRLSFITEENGEYFHISLVKSEDKLAYCEINQGEKKSKLIINKFEIKRYLEFFNKQFKTSKSEEDFKKEIDSIWIFSNACGFSGEPTKEWKQIENYIKKGELYKIRQFLYSLDVEAQAYGIIGMIELQKKNVKITDKDIQVINYLKNRNSNVYTCMGCIYGDIIGIKELVKYFAN